jgi:hypothetical protein
MQPHASKDAPSALFSGVSRFRDDGGEVEEVKMLLG